jgi:5-formyltetrahydrofolate cyclo-ligase
MDKLSTRKALIEARLNMPDRLARADLLQRVMRIWLFGRTDEVIGAYWPIKGEFDPLPALYRWQEDAILSQESQENMPLAPEGRSQLATESIASRSPRKIGLPVVNKLHRTLTFHAWYPGCPMEEDAYGIPKPKDTEVIVPLGLWRRLLRPDAGDPASPARDSGLGLQPWLAAGHGARAARHSARCDAQRQGRGLAGVGW